VNPILANIIRGSIVESAHRGAYVVVNAKGLVAAEQGDIDRPIFPRSAIKAFQCLPVIESGAADQFGLTGEEIALCCSSHNGEAEHLRVAASILNKSGANEADYECGSHWPERADDKAALTKSNELPRSIHNNCSGKHAGMIALAKHLSVPVRGYTDQSHPVQKAIAKAMGAICDVDLDQCSVGIDGCSVPTWALPLRNTALGFACLASPSHTAGQRIITSVRAHPFMVAGTGRFDTKIMQAIPRLFIKVGAEGVFCGTIPHAQFGFALKIDDGGTRGAEVAVAAMLSKIDVWTMEERAILETFTHSILKNWMKKEVGEAKAAF
jgi:L-asparaginase II